MKTLLFMEQLALDKPSNQKNDFLTGCHLNLYSILRTDTAKLLHYWTTKKCYLDWKQLDQNCRRYQKIIQFVKWSRRLIRGFRLSTRYLILPKKEPRTREDNQNSCRSGLKCTFWQSSMRPEKKTSFLFAYKVDQSLKLSDKV